MCKVLFQFRRGLEVDRCFGVEFLFFGVWERKVVWVMTGDGKIG